MGVDKTDRRSRQKAANSSTDKGVAGRNMLPRLLGSRKVPAMCCCQRPQDAAGKERRPIGETSVVEGGLAAVLQSEIPRSARVSRRKHAKIRRWEANVAVCIMVERMCCFGAGCLSTAPGVNEGSLSLSFFRRDETLGRVSDQQSPVRKWRWGIACSSEKRESGIRSRRTSIDDSIRFRFTASGRAVEDRRFGSP